MEVSTRYRWNIYVPLRWVPTPEAVILLVCTIAHRGLASPWPVGPRRFSYCTRWGTEPKARLRYLHLTSSTDVHSSTDEQKHELVPWAKEIIVWSMQQGMERENSPFPICNAASYHILTAVACSCYWIMDVLSYRLRCSHRCIILISSYIGRQ